MSGGARINGSGGGSRTMTVSDDIAADEDVKMDKILKSDPTGVANTKQIKNMIEITSDGYDALVTPETDTLYVIVG